jgi:competence protein ComEC
MLAAVLLAVVLRRHLAPGRALALAALVVMGIDPLALLNAGFWLSFGGVFWLLFALDGRSREAWWRTYALAQWASFVALLPLGIAWFQQASLVGPLVNFVAIPWVSFVLVPLVLLAIALHGWAEPLAQWVLQLAAWVGAVYLDGLAHAASPWWAQAPLPPPSTATVLVAVVGAGIVLLPRAVPARWLGLVMLLPLGWPRVEPLPLRTVELTVLDVGQGLAVVVRTRRHALLYDAGPARPEGFDSGQAIVAPALRTLGVRRLDRLVASHGDNDHAGGVPAILRSHRPPVVQSGPGAGIGEPCVAGERWTWDGVEFEFLHPPAYFPALRNEASCVLRISIDGQSALLPGDIGAVVEQRLLRAGVPLRASLLLLPHHGSRGSSSAAFLDAVAPQHAIVSAGFRNRFGHPAAEVVARVEAVGARLHATPARGALRLRVDAEGVRLLAAERDDARRLWQEP